MQPRHHLRYQQWWKALKYVLLLHGMVAEYDNDTVIYGKTLCGELRSSMNLEFVPALPAKGWSQQCALCGTGIKDGDSEIDVELQWQDL